MIRIEKYHFGKRHWWLNDELGDRPLYHEEQHMHKPYNTKNVIVLHGNNRITISDTNNITLKEVKRIDPKIKIVRLKNTFS